MKQLDRYIAAHVVGATGLALFALLALFAFVSLVEELGAVGDGEYTIWRAVEHVALTLPRYAFSLFPIAAVIGSLMGLGVMAASSELVVMRASGVSVLRIVGAVMKGGALLMVVAILLGEVVAPRTERMAGERRSMALSGRTTLMTGFGFWVRDGNSFINIRQVVPGNRMGDLFIYEFDEENRLRVATHAKEARYEAGQWRLRDVRQTRIEDRGVSHREVGQALWDSVLKPELVNVVSVKPQSLSAVGLHRYIAYLRANGLNPDRFELAFWSKIVYPIATVTMIFLAVPMVLGRLQAVGIGQRIVVGAVIGVVFHVVQQASGHIGIVYGVTPMISATAPCAVLLMTGIWLVRRLP